MTPFDFGVLLADRFLEKQSEGEVHPLQSPMAGYREEQFRQRQQQQQEQQAQQQQMTQQQSANLPQGPTAVNYPNIAPPQELAVNDVPGAQPGGPPAGQPKTAGVAQDLGNRARALYQRAAWTAGDLGTTYSTEGGGSAAAKGLSMASDKMKDIMKAIMAKYQQANRGPKSIAGQIAQKGLAEKGAGMLGQLAGGAMNFGKGMYAATKPLTGLATGGFKGMGKGFQTAGKMMYSGDKFSPAAAAGAALAAYGMYNSLQAPIERTGTGVRFRSPIKIPNVAVRSPVINDGGGVNVRSPIKVLW